MSSRAYQQWRLGLCVCCPGDLEEWIDGTPPRAIGEGVMICGRCNAMDHMELDGEDVLTEAILKAIILRDDEPIDTAIAGARR